MRGYVFRLAAVFAGVAVAAAELFLSFVLGGAAETSRHGEIWSDAANGTVLLGLYYLPLAAFALSWGLDISIWAERRKFAERALIFLLGLPLAAAAAAVGMIFVGGVLGAELSSAPIWALKGALSMLAPGAVTGGAHLLLYRGDTPPRSARPPRRTPGLVISGSLIRPTLSISRAQFRQGAFDLIKCAVLVFFAILFVMLVFQSTQRLIAVTAAWALFLSFVWAMLCLFANRLRALNMPPVLAAAPLALVLLFRLIEVMAGASSNEHLKFVLNGGFALYAMLGLVLLFWADRPQMQETR